MDESPRDVLRTHCLTEATGLSKKLKGKRVYGGEVDGKVWSAVVIDADYFPITVKLPDGRSKKVHADLFHLKTKEIDHAGNKYEWYASKSRGGTTRITLDKKITAKDL
jgi:hypothetical protein